MQNETLLASAAKVTAVNTLAGVSVVANTGAISAVAGTLAAAYSAVQIIKALPWITDYIVAIRSGLRGDWSHWRSIARKEEKSNGNSQS